METRVLRYFLAVAREQNISAAADTLFRSQPALSRQMMELERDLGVRLFNRGQKGRKLELTEEGLLLKKRAEEIMIHLEKTENEIKSSFEDLSGDLYIGAGESPSFDLIARTCTIFMKQYPNVQIHLYSGNADDVRHRLDNGILDYGLFIGNVLMDGLEYLTFTARDEWGILISSEHPLAEKSAIKPEDLNNVALLVSEQSRNDDLFTGWLRRELQSLNIVGRYNLVYNASLLAAENAGAVLSLKGLVSSCMRRELRFIPLDPPLYASLNLAWRSSHDLSRQARIFLNLLQNEMQSSPGFMHPTHSLR
ncbi:LysR family transcriptional regulator [Ileibacterium valens]|uniref:LysR family transcriptional regulator n=1 Tax=Ileibacterium valens TaxID=1862668 RepID=UPI00259B8C7A|nr:LysR family transcriptional regulator [Ileibacterium valens]